jgi:C1A family cysteine protease
VESFDKEPSAFCYAFGQDFQAIQYYRLDPPGATREAVLRDVKAHAAAGLPTMFGFTVYSSIDSAGEDGRIPFPQEGDRVVGGHAVCAVGYDDAMSIKGPKGTKATRGALLIRNSWGKGWGERGYGWLPYDYVLKGLAIDWWALLKNEWVDTEQFGP